MKPPLRPGTFASIFSEAGTNDTSIQAAYLEYVYQRRVTHIFWFCWSDGMVPAYGVVNSAGAPKPPYWQYREVAPP